MWKRRTQTDLQLSRVQQTWLMLALLCSAAPIWIWLPFWVPILTLMGIGWRAAMIWRGSVKPSRTMMILLAITLIAADLFTYWPPIGLEPMTSLLLGACCLKYLEMRQLRDAQLLLNLCYFIAGIQLIFTFEIIFFVFAIFSILVTLSAQNILQRSPKQQYSLTGLSIRPLASAARIAMFSLPLMLIVFVFAPRLPSFWAVPTQQGAGKTGVSESMNPGSIGSLTRSDDLAFRVSFQTDVPPPYAMYWRGLVLNDFDGEVWNNNAASSANADRNANEVTLRELFSSYWTDMPTAKRWQSEIDYSGDAIRYTIYQEPTNQRWLFAIPAPKTSTSGLGITDDQRLVSRLPIRQRTRYDVESFPDYTFQPDGLDSRELQRTLSLPSGYNPKSIALGNSWRDLGLPTTEIVASIRRLINQEFTYTLDPGVYGTDSVDDFLFNRKRGFCEHFASAAVVLMRASGIPSRIVTGYQGGERSPYNDYILVHQYDAHAWAEYWVAGAGWTRLDPTAFVAPQRIEFGARDLFESEQSFLADSPFSLNRFGDIAWANWLRLRADNLNYLWGRWVLGYDGSLQLEFLQSIFGAWSLGKLILVLMVLALIALLCISIYFRVRSPNVSVTLVEKRYRLFCKHCEKLGLDISSSTTPRQIALAAAEHLPLEQIKDVQNLCKLFERQMYAGSDLDAEVGVLMRKLKRMLLASYTSRKSAIPN